MLLLVSLSLGLAFLCGLNLYLATALTSLAVQQGWVNPALHPALAALGHPAIFSVALLLFLAEFIIDKIPWVDSFWDAIHTLIRPAGALLLTWLILQSTGHTHPASTTLLMILSGLLALTTHLTKSGIRLILNASPEPFSNIFASLAEDLAVASLLLLLVKAPVTGATTCLLLLIGTWIALPRLLRLIHTSLSLTLKKLTAAPVAAPSPLPSLLPIASQETLRLALPEATAPILAAWAIPCVSGKTHALPGLPSNHPGTLIAPADHPGTLLFLFRSGFRRRAVRLSLAGALIQRDTTLLSENLVLHQPADDRLAVFRFTRAESALVTTLVLDLRARLGLNAPTNPVPSPLAEPVTEIWKAPDSLRS